MNPDDLIFRMRKQLMNELIESFGFEIPEAGTDDHETWLIRKDEIAAIRTMDDVRSYLEDSPQYLSAFLKKFDL